MTPVIPLADLRLAGGRRMRTLPSCSCIIHPLFVSRRGLKPGAPAADKLLLHSDAALRPGADRGGRSSFRCGPHRPVLAYNLAGDVHGFAPSHRHLAHRGRRFRQWRRRRPCSARSSAKAFRHLYSWGGRRPPGRPREPAPGRCEFRTERHPPSKRSRGNRRAYRAAAVRRRSARRELSCREGRPTWRRLNGSTCGQLIVSQAVPPVAQSRRARLQNGVANGRAGCTHAGARRHSGIPNTLGSLAAVRRGQVLEHDAIVTSG